MKGKEEEKICKNYDYLSAITPSSQTVILVTHFDLALFLRAITLTFPEHCIVERSNLRHSKAFHLISRTQIHPSSH